MNDKLALFWEKHENGVRCLLCPNYCVITTKNSGICRKRVNIADVLYTLNYAETIAFNLDPLEKKPLYHFYPEEKVLSLGANSCNLSCHFCQNHSESQMDSKKERILPKELLNICLSKNINHVSFTYTEPFTWYEYVLESAELLTKNNISVILVTNGYVNLEPLKVIVPYISAMNIDLKAFSDSFYQNICGGKLKPVLDAIEYVFEKVHLEITLLLIESLNDDVDELRQYFAFLKGLNPNLPLHISRYFPRYKMKISETSEQLLQKVAKKAQEHLNYVYIGNVGATEYQNTYCPKCKTLLINRQHFNTKIVGLNDRRCVNCGKSIPITQ